VCDQVAAPIDGRSGRVATQGPVVAPAAG
jgi:hypothetical protein